MKTWQMLSQPFTAPNGLTVEPVGSQAVLAEMGRQFRNGLAVHHDMWADKCVRGTSQIVRVLDGDRMVANAELVVNGGRVVSLFNRAEDNRDVAADEPAGVALDAYVAAVNENRLATDIDVLRGGFAQPVVAESVEAAAAQVLWTPLSVEFYARNGLTVEPVADADALRRLGEDMNCGLIASHRRAVEACRTGESQFVRIERDGTPVAYAEFHVSCGQVVAVFLRGVEDAPADIDCKLALNEYLTAVNGGRLPLTVALGMNGFRPIDEPLEALLEGEVALSPHASAQRAVRHGYVGGYDGNDFDGDEGDFDEDDEDDFNEDEDEVEVEVPLRDMAQPLRWTPLTEAYWAANGLRVEAVSSEEILRVMGETFRNALMADGPRRRWAEKCHDGSRQIVRIMRGDVMVANAELMVRGGRVVSLFNRAEDNRQASPEADEALNEYLNAVNAREIGLALDVGDDGFRAPQPLDEAAPPAETPIDDGGHGWHV